MLTTVLDTLEGVDDAVKGFYSETDDGKFVLKLNGIDLHPEVQGLKGAYEKVKKGRDDLRNEVSTLKTQIAEFPEDFDAEKWSKAKDGKADEAALVTLRKQLEADRDTWKGKFEASEAAMRKSALDRDLTDALTAAGVNKPALLQGARAIHSDQVKISEDGKPFVDTDMGPLGLKEYVARWAASPEGQDYVTSAQGGGAPGGSQQQKKQVQGDFGGDRAARTAAIAAKFPNLK